MGIQFLNCFTCSPRLPPGVQSGTLCLFIESDQGLVLVDTGLGQDDYAHRSGILRVFQLVTVMPLNPQEAAVHQVARLGHRPEDVRHIVLTHMHFDHCGGLPDFPHAAVHVHRRELDAFAGPPRRWTDVGYVRRQIAHEPQFVRHEETGESWFDFPAIRLPFQPPMWLVPLFGHTHGHCGVAVRTPSGWLFHVGDAAPIGFTDDPPEWLTRLVMGPHTPRLRRFKAAHPEIRLTTGHMPLDFFQRSDS
jgi:glyoxylase-like metal-dependent hydrolase (beta-lactamase superfamily II)